MPTQQILKPQHNVNKCKHCNIATRCIPGNLERGTIKQLLPLNFQSHILEKGQHLYRQGEQFHNLYLLRTGILKSYTIHEDGSEHIMGFHLPPCLFGWEGIDEKQLSVSVKALDHSNVCIIPIQDIPLLLNTDPTIASQFFQLISQRIEKCNENSLRGTAEQRVASFILQLTKHYTMLGYPYYFCKLIMTHQDIANYLRIAPETISRTLHGLETKGLINLQRKTIYLNDVKTLERIATEIH